MPGSSGAQRVRAGTSSDRDAAIAREGIIETRETRRRADDDGGGGLEQRA
jgi:hypothetical protein